MTQDLATVRKFTFDTVFDGEGAVWSAPRAKRSYTPEEVEAIKAEAFAEGERSVVARAELDHAGALDEIAALTRQAFGVLVQVAHDHRTGSTELALAAGRKIADAALDRFPQAPVAAALASLAREVEAQPKLIVRTSPDSVERVQAQLAETAQGIGFPGAITVHAEPTLSAGAFVLEWGEGRAAFDPDAAAARVAAALETALAAEGLHAEPLTSETLPPSNEADHG